MTNWKTTASAIGVAITSLLSLIAIAPSELGDMSLIIPPAYKAKVAAVSALAAFALRVINGTWQKDKDVTGGNRIEPPKIP